MDNAFRVPARVPPLKHVASHCVAARALQLLQPAPSRDSHGVAAFSPSGRIRSPHCCEEHITHKMPARPARAAAAAVLVWLHAVAHMFAYTSGAMPAPACPSPAGPGLMVVVDAPTPFFSWTQCTWRALPHTPGALRTNCAEGGRDCTLSPARLAACVCARVH